MNLEFFFVLSFLFCKDGDGGEEFMFLYIFDNGVLYNVMFFRNESLLKVLNCCFWGIVFTRWLLEMLKIVSDVSWVSFWGIFSVSKFLERFKDLRFFILVRDDGIFFLRLLFDKLIFWIFLRFSMKLGIWFVKVLFEKLMNRKIFNILE